MPITIRRALESHAAAACDVVRRSIRDLCVADHADDESTLTAWLRNKTPDMFARLIQAESKSCVVGVLDVQVCGFGHLNHSGEIGLLYVAPEARFLGVSTRMLQWLEAEAVRLGVATVFLKSSFTARRFHAARGYAQTGEPTAGFGMTRTWPMTKRVSL